MAIIELPVPLGVKFPNEFFMGCKRPVAVPPQAYGLCPFTRLYIMYQLFMLITVDEFPTFDVGESLKIIKPLFDGYDNPH